jgi:hypothetical protein
MEPGREIDHLVVSAVRFCHNVVAVEPARPMRPSAGDLFAICSHHFVCLPLLTGLGHEIFDHYPAVEG